MIRLQDVSFFYGTRPAIHAVSLAISEGEFAAVVGPNGSGKSTLLKLMSGVFAPTAGHVEVHGHAVASWNAQERARRIAVVSSDDHFAFPFTVEEIVLMGRLPYLRRLQREGAHDRKVVREAIEACDLWELRSRAISELSSGERQRVLIARALAQEPRVLLLDEPTTHLDIAHEWALLDTVLQLHRQRQLTVVCALHDLQMAARYANRVIVLANGQVVADGAPRAVFQEATIAKAFGVPVSIEWAGDRDLLLSPREKGIVQEHA